MVGSDNTANINEGESMYWDGKEYEYDEDIFMQENIPNNQSSIPAIATYYDEESSINNFNFSHQEIDVANSSSNSKYPIGLTLGTTPTFLNSVKMSAFEGKSTTITNDLMRRRHSESEKVKAANFHAASIKIGNWQMVSRHEGDLVAKLYYAKHKLVWEVLQGALKYKMEMSWSAISAIRAIMPDNEPATLEVELSQPPSYFREVDPQPKKLTLWEPTSDFTRGQAPIWRRHTVRFGPGILDKHYKTLLQFNKVLFDMSKKPFPSGESPYFDPTMGILEICPSFKGPYGSNYSQGLQYNNQSYSAPLRESSLMLPPNPSIPAMKVSYANEEGNLNDDQLITHQLQAQATLWDQGLLYNNQVYGYQTQYPNFYQPINVGLQNDIEKHFRGDQSQFPSSNHDQDVIPANLWSSIDSLEATDVINPNYNYSNYSSTGYQHQYLADQTMHDARNNAYVANSFFTEQHVNLNVLPQQYSDNNVVMNNEGSSSLPSYNYPSQYPTSDAFFKYNP